MTLITHYGCAVLGAVLGFAAAALLASGHEPTEVRMVDPVTCLECRHSRTESHGGERELVCWKRPATGGRVVRPSGWCSDGERGRR